MCLGIGIGRVPVAAQHILDRQDTLLLKYSPMWTLQSSSTAWMLEGWAQVEAVKQSGGGGSGVNVEFHISNKIKNNHQQQSARKAPSFYTYTRASTRIVLDWLTNEMHGMTTNEMHLATGIDLWKYSYSPSNNSLQKLNNLTSYSY